MTRNVFVGIPTRDPLVKVNTMASVVDAVYDLGSAGMAMTLFNWSGDPLISHARNVVLATFLLKTDCSDLLFVDDDVSWERGAVTRLMGHPVDVVAGVYRHKRDPESYPVNWFDEGKIMVDNATGLLDARDVPFGFTRVTRKAAEQMWEAAKDKPFQHSSAPDLECRLVFDMMYEDGKYFGEDYVFCRKWRDLGGKVWIDPELNLIHTGWKDYHGHIGKWLKGQSPHSNGNDPAALRQAFREIAEALKPASAA